MIEAVLGALGVISSSVCIYIDRYQRLGSLCACLCYLTPCSPNIAHPQYLVVSVIRYPRSSMITYSLVLNPNLIKSPSLHSTNLLPSNSTPFKVVPFALSKSIAYSRTPDVLSPNSFVFVTNLNCNTACCFEQLG